MAGQKTTIKDIARECEVSLSTVSLVLNNSPRISRVTRDRVMAAVKRHDYQPNVHARGLVSRYSRVLSITVPALSHVFADIYFGEIASGIYDRASEDGYKVLLDIAKKPFIEGKEYLNLLKTRRADGMLFIASSVHDTYLLDFEQEAYPFLLVNHYFPESRLDYITVDYRACAVMAATHLLELGHRRIGVIAGTNTHTGIDFLESLTRSCREHGIPEGQIRSVESDWDEEGGFAGASRLLGMDPTLTAIVGSNDRMAIGAMRYLHTRGLGVPGDISVMGMDDIAAAGFTTPGLTTIRLDLYEIGRKACTRLLELISQQRTECRELIPSTLVRRESTGPARQA